MRREQLLTVRELADELNLGRGYVRQLATEGKIPGFKLGGPHGSWRFRRRAITAWQKLHENDWSNNATTTKATNQ